MSEDIWLKVKDGDVSAMKKIYEESYRELYSFGMRVVADPEKAKDALHEMFCELWQNRANQGPINQTLPYLRTYLKRKLLKELSRESILLNLDEDDTRISPEYSYEELLIKSQSSKILQEKLSNALDKLTPSQKKVIQLKFFQGLSYHQISELLQKSPRTIYNFVYEALSSLKKGMK